jgi:hypothetical protein
VRFLFHKRNPRRRVGKRAASGNRTKSYSMFHGTWLQPLFRFLHAICKNINAENESPANTAYLPSFLLERQVQNHLQETRAADRVLNHAQVAGWWD